MSATVTLEPWGSGDLPLLERLMGDPHMTEHLGGPESPDKLRERQGRYERLEGGDRMFKIVDVASGAGVGSVGFWTKEWRDEQVYEVGWMVVPEFQGRGIAVAATAQAIELAKRDDKHRFMHAFPNVDNAPSNAICRKLGFELLEACEFEFPKGHFMTCNDWRLGPARLRARPPVEGLAVCGRRFEVRESGSPSRRAAIVHAISSARPSTSVSRRPGDGRGLAASRRRDGSTGPRRSLEPEISAPVPSSAGARSHGICATCSVETRRDLSRKELRTALSDASALAPA